MKRVALLGATGSIGAQAIDIVERNPELELCALMSGTQPLAELAAAHGVEHVQVGGSAAELLRAGEPDIVLNAIVGFAGVEATLWALERGITLALANKESLVAAGELAVAAHRRGGGLLLPVDSEHSAHLPVPRGPGSARRSSRSSSPPRAARSAAARAPSSSTSRSTTRSPIQPGRWDERSLWTPPRSPTRASS